MISMVKETSPAVVYADCQGRPGTESGSSLFTHSVAHAARQSVSSRKETVLALGEQSIHAPSLLLAVYPRLEKGCKGG